MVTTTIITSASHFIDRFVFGGDEARITVVFKSGDSRDYVADFDTQESIYAMIDSGESPGKVYNAYLKGGEKVQDVMTI